VNADCIAMDNYHTENNDFKNQNSSKLFEIDKNL